MKIPVCKNGCFGIVPDDQPIYIFSDYLKRLDIKGIFMFFKNGFPSFKIFGQLRVIKRVFFRSLFQKIRNIFQMNLSQGFSNLS